MRACRAFAPSSGGGSSSGGGKALIHRLSCLFSLDGGKGAGGGPSAAGAGAGEGKASSAVD